MQPCTAQQHSCRQQEVGGPQSPFHSRAAQHPPALARPRSMLQRARTAACPIASNATPLKDAALKQVQQVFGSIQRLQLSLGPAGQHLTQLLCPAGAGLLQRGCQAGSLGAVPRAELLHWRGRRPYGREFERLTASGHPCRGYRRMANRVVRPAVCAVLLFTAPHTWKASASARRSWLECAPSQPSVGSA